jgi:hypothetical protein
MSQVEIEAEWDQLGPGDVRDLASKSWLRFVEKERSRSGVSECAGDDPRLLSVLDEVVAKADETRGQGLSGKGVPARLKDWTTG